MPLFNKKKETEDTTKQESVPVAKKDASKKEASKETKKKTSKNAKKLGANLTKAPGRILKSQRITEKAAYMTVNDVYVFEVAQDATKRDVSTAIQTLYGVTPRKVNMIRRQPRAYVARFRNRRGTKTGMKKAMVFLNKGDKIDLG